MCSRLPVSNLKEENYLMQHVLVLHPVVPMSQDSMMLVPMYWYTMLLAPASGHSMLLVPMSWNSFLLVLSLGTWSYWSPCPSSPSSWSPWPGTPSCWPHVLVCQLASPHELELHPTGPQVLGLYFAGSIHYCYSILFSKSQTSHLQNKNSTPCCFLAIQSVFWISS